MFKKLTLLVSAILLVIVLSYTTAAKGTLQYPAFHKGMSYVAWSKDSFSKSTSDESLKSMADIGTNCVAIIPTWYQEEFNSVKMRPTDRTPSDNSIRHAIRKAHEYGMSVMLKPHIDLEMGRDQTRADIGFQQDADWDRWFENYENFILRYAKIAERENVEFFCVGTELAFASTMTDKWRSGIIPAVRKAFSGQVVYAANWDEYSFVKFWDALDYAGIDAYFPLAKSTGTGFYEIKEGWSRWLDDIEGWQRRIKKPVIFTESGYCSADIAAVKPWEEAVSGKANPVMQADCYKALFETFWDRPWFFGMYWWTWSTYAGAGGESNRGFTPQNKLAMDYVKEWYGKLVNKNFLFSEYGGMGEDLRERLKVEEVKRAPRYDENGTPVRFASEMADRRDEQGKDFPRVRF